MRRPFEELGERVSQAVLFSSVRRCPPACLASRGASPTGAEQGVFAVSDPDFLANLLYAQGLGAMHLARVSAGVRELAPGVPQIFPVDAKDVMRNAVEMTFTHVLAPGTNGKAPAAKADSEPAGRPAADAQS